MYGRGYHYEPHGRERVSISCGYYSTLDKAKAAMTYKAENRWEPDPDTYIVHEIELDTQRIVNTYSFPKV